MAEIKEEYPHMIIEEKKTYNPFATLASLSLITKDQVEQYNSQLDLFYSRYSAYLNSFYDFELKNNLSIKIQLFLTNNGNTPAEDVDVYCHFPDGFNIIDEDDNEDPLDEPVPPSTPKTFFENIGNINIRPFMPNMYL